MKLSVSDIINQLTDEVPESSIQAPPEDPVAFAESIEKVASGEVEETPTPSMSIEEMAKIAVVDTLMSQDANAFLELEGVFSNEDAILPIVTEEEKLAAMWEEDKAPIAEAAATQDGLETYRDALIGNSGQMGLFIGKEFGLLD